MKATFAAEVGRTNGPFDNPESWDKYKLFNKLTFNPTPARASASTEMSYAGNWHGSGQIPARAVEQGLISRFGSIDPDEGGNTARHQLALQYRLRPTENSELRALAYVGDVPLQPVLELHALSARSRQRRRDRADRSPHVLRRPRSATASCTSSARVTLRHDDRRRRAQRRHPRGAVGHAAPPAADRRAQQRRPRDLRRRVLQRGDHAGALAPRRPRRSRRPALASRSTIAWPAAIPRRPQSGVDGAHQLSPKASLIVTAARSAGRAARRLRQLRPRLSLERRARRVRAAGGHAADARDRRGGRRARAAARSMGSGGRALAARPRQRDGLERRRRHDRRQRSDQPQGRSSSRRATR